ncbi:MAG TPA: DUF2917 domain-containing protein [Accumulibacter sp.]|jgi:hypothetical protein|nr:DUF2917 domain-containing protein [Accumulibacter sp.]HQC81315.1 DUF2917 domain-containing protein [Accumulibacter sp.]
MDLDLFNSELCLSHAAPVRLLSAKGVRIVCTSGVVWLTVHGEPGDIFLRRGESYRVRGDGLALLEGIGEGRVRFQKAAHPLRSVIATLRQGLPRVSRLTENQNNVLTLHI